nr:SPOR domain-containing protein [Pseudoroseomonas coralli]
MPGKSAAPAAAPATGNWGVQVGAFASANLARAAAGEARGRLGIGSARPHVEPVAQSHGTLYRARVLGLSRESAQAACEKLRSAGACIIVSPEAQG